MKTIQKLLILAAALTVLLTALTACGGASDSLKAVQEQGVLVGATSPDFPPFEYLENGEPVGVEIELMQAVAEKLGVTLKIEQVDFDSIIPGIQSGKYDVGMAGITVDEKRKKNVDFSDVFFTAAQKIVVQPGSEIASKDDLTGKTIAVQTGTTAESVCMDGGYELLSFTSNNDAAAALTSGKADAWVVDSEVAAALAEQQGLVVLDEAMTEEPYAFAFKKGSDTLVQAVNQALAELKADGTVQKIFEKYDVAYNG